MLVHDEEQYFKVQLEKIDKHEEHNISLHAKVTEKQKEMIACQNKLKPILEGKENNKWLKRLDGLKYDVDQDVM